MNYDLDGLVLNFRNINRELFINFDRIRNASNDSIFIPDHFEEHFKDIENILWKAQVLEPLELEIVEYGLVNQNILVKPNYCSTAPIMLNREVHSGYWDFPKKEISSDDTLFFVSFFDFDTSRALDHQYVQITVGNCPSDQSINGKRGLIEYQHTKFTLR